MNITEFAKIAGVSRSTVSRYFNNGYISEEKRARITHAIEKTGFHPSRQAQMLRSGHSHLIGVIMPKVNSHSTSRMLEGISEALENSGYRLILADTHNQNEEEINYLRVFEEEHVDGIILMGTIFSNKHFKAMKKLSVPLVVLGQKLDEYPCVYHDDYHAMYNVANTVLQHVKNPAYIGVTEADLAVGKARKEAFLAAANKHNIHIADTHIVSTEFTSASGYTAARLLFERDTNIDALCCATDAIAIGAMRYLREQKIAIPKQVQVSGIGDGEIAQVVSPSLTTSHLAYKRSGQEAARILLDHIKNNSSDIQNICMANTLVARDSTR